MGCLLLVLEKKKVVKEERGTERTVTSETDGQWKENIFQERGGKRMKTNPTGRGVFDAVTQKREERGFKGDHTNKSSRDSRGLQDISVALRRKSPIKRQKGWLRMMGACAGSPGGQRTLRD